MGKKLSISNDNKQHNSVLFFFLFIAAIAAVAIIANLLTGQAFLHILNIKSIISSLIYPIFIAWGICFLFACGYFDLSLGGILILASFGAVAAGNIWGYPGVILGGMISGTCLVFFNFFVFAFTRIPSWISSVGLALVYESIAIFLRQNFATRQYVDAELNAGYRAIGNMPVNLILLGAGFVIVYILYNRTSVGLNIRAVGGNESVSRALGVNTRRTILYVGLICGLLMGVAAMIQQSYNLRTTVLPAMTSIVLIFKPLAIALLAQVLQKRINIIIAVPFCALIIYGVFNLMTFFHIQSGTLQDVFLCIFIVAFGIGGQRGVREVVK